MAPGKSPNNAFNIHKVKMACVLNELMLYSRRTRLEPWWRRPTNYRKCKGTVFGLVPYIQDPFRPNYSRNKMPHKVYGYTGPYLISFGHHVYGYKIDYTNGGLEYSYSLISIAKREENIQFMREYYTGDSLCPIGTIR